MHAPAILIHNPSRTFLGLVDPLHGHGVLVNTASLQALLHTKGEVGWDHLLELVDVLAINGVGEAERSFDDIVIQSEEVLGDLAGTRVVAVETGDEAGRLAGGVVLEVDAALREDSALEGTEGGVEFGGQAVLKHEARLDEAAGDGEELSGARVDVRGVHAARVEEGDL
jgi:hypothetical protein